MKKSIRILCMCLALLMLVLTVVSCANEGDGTKDPSSNIPKETSDSTDESTPTLGFEPENNNGTVITILMPLEKKFEIGTEEYSTTDRVSAAMYSRNCTVEEYLGIVFEIKEESGSWANRNAYNQKIENSVTVAKEYDIITGQTSCTFVPCAQKGCFQDLNAIESFNFDSEWWVQDMTENYAIEGRLYGVTGDLSLSLYRSMAVLYFNQYLIEQYQMKSPYDMVRDGSWTLENMMTMAKSVEEDIDGTYDRTKNMMGFMPYFTVNRNFLTALEAPLVERDADTGEVTVPMNPDEKLVDIFDLMYEAYENENTIYCDGSLDCLQYFTQNTVLITGSSFNDVEKLRDMEKDYGIVPLPKYNEEQKDYLSAISQDVLMWHLPVNTPNAELCAKAMEALSFYGLYDVTPEYYEVTLGLTYARDKNVQEMLSIMRNNAVMRWESIYDMAFNPSMWNIIQMTDAFRHPASNKVGTYHGDNVTTFWARNQSKWQTGADNLYNILSSLSQ